MVYYKQSLRSFNGALKKRKPSPARNYSNIDIWN